MKRHMDLVRAILLRLDEHELGYAPAELKIEGYTSEQISYHVYLMGQGGLLEVADVSSDDTTSPQAIPLNLTWAGHEFLANARAESNWLQAKKVMGGAGDVSFSILTDVLKKLVSQSLGL